MHFYFLLSVATAVIVLLAVLIWKKTRSLGFLLGTGALYYWSLYGAWSIVTDRLGEDSGMHYRYLEAKLFPIYLDADYAMALVLYTLFIIVVQLSILFFVRPQTRTRPSDGTISIVHPLVILICFAAAVVSFWIMREGLLLAIIQNRSAYKVTRGASGVEVSPLFSIHQALNRLAIFPAVIGLAVTLSGARPRLIRGTGSKWWAIPYVGLLAGMFAFCLALGNKNELLVGGLGGTLFYLANAERPRTGAVLGLGVAGMLALGLIDMLRGVPLTQLADAVRNLDTETLWLSLQAGSTSNEAFGAHFSMYGALVFDVPLTWGSSIGSFVASAVPRAFWPDRPDDIYIPYVEGVRATPGQGYSIHHATGWYLNFGVPGVILGAILLGAVWAGCFNSSLRADLRQGRLLYIFSALSASMLVAYLPALIRSGPEVYKGLILEAFVAPTVVLGLASILRRPGREAVPPMLPVRMPELPAPQS